MTYYWLLVTVTGYWLRTWTHDRPVGQEPGGDRDTRVTHQADIVGGGLGGAQNFSSRLAGAALRELITTEVRHVIRAAEHYSQ